MSQAVEGEGNEKLPHSPGPLFGVLGVVCLLLENEPVTRNSYKSGFPLSPAPETKLGM